MKYYPLPVKVVCTVMIAVTVSLLPIYGLWVFGGWVLYDRR
jgi:hypothetical protein